MRSMNRLVKEVCWICSQDMLFCNCVNRFTIAFWTLYRQIRTKVYTEYWAKAHSFSFQFNTVTLSNWSKNQRIFNALLGLPSIGWYCDHIIVQFYNGPIQSISVIVTAISHYCGEVTKSKRCQWAPRIAQYGVKQCYPFLSWGLRVAKTVVTDPTPQLQSFCAY